MTWLFLPVPPVIADAEFVSDISVVQGTSITMECKTAGVPEPTITWYKEGEIIQVDQLPNFRLQQAGRVMQVGGLCFNGCYRLVDFCVTHSKNRQYIAKALYTY